MLEGKRAVAGVRDWVTNLATAPLNDEALKRLRTWSGQTPDAPDAPCPTPPWKSRPEEIEAALERCRRHLFDAWAHLDKGHGKQTYELRGMHKLRKRTRVTRVHTSVAGKDGDFHFDVSAADYAAFAGGEIDSLLFVPLSVPEIPVLLVPLGELVAQPNGIAKSAFTKLGAKRQCYLRRTPRSGWELHFPNTGSTTKQVPRTYPLERGPEGVCWLFTKRSRNRARAGHAKS